MKGFGLSPLTNKIFYGTQNKEKNIWTGNKVDVTDEVVGVVFQWFEGNMDNKKEYSITFPSSDFELVMRRKGK